MSHFERRTEEGERHGRRGFTLLELLIATALTAILVVLSLPLFSGLLSSYKVDAAARVVWSDLQSAKMSAMQANQSVSVVLAGTTGYTYSYVDGLANTHTVSQDLSGDYPGVTVSFNGPASLTFDSMGMKQPPTPGTSVRVTVGNASKALSFSVNWTGAIGSL